MMTYSDPHMTVTMTVMEIYTSVMLVRHFIQNMAITMMVGIIKKSCRHNNLAVTVNDADP